jgi:hypothetical protein
MKDPGSITKQFLKYKTNTIPILMHQMRISIRSNPQQNLQEADPETLGEGQHQIRWRKQATIGTSPGQRWLTIVGGLCSSQ